MSDEQSVPGKLDLEALRELVAQGEIETIVTAFPDMYGRLMGKRIAGPYFLNDVVEHGIHLCNYLLACDVEMEPIPGYDFTSWAQGYGDVHCRPDWHTLRRATWLDKMALVFCDVHDEDTGELVEIAPRTVLKRQMDRARAAGFLPLGGAELEMFIFRESYESARQKGFQNLEPFGGYIEDYHILQGTREEPLVGAIRRHLDRSGVPVEFSKGEWGAGQHEINVRYADFLEMSDRSVVFKQVCKEIAMQQGLAVTFMAKWHEEAAGNSLHLHASLWDLAGDHSLFPGEGELPGLPVGVSDTFRWFLGGLLAHAREVSLFFAPSVNSYKRYQPGSFAPTGIAWAYDNRTAGFRIVGHGDGLRVECRIPGADANPYLAFAALLAAGLDGIERRIEPPPAFSGNVYTAEVPRVPSSLNEAIAEFGGSEFVRRAFGDEVVEHYLHFARTEQRLFDRAVTTWERARFFERI